jgi:TRAP-type C4-dicarboxylate transport system permease small subunit
MFKLLKVMNAALARLLLGIGAAGLLVMTLVVGWQVFGRYILRESPSWSEQTALLLMIWYACFAAAAGVRQGFHIRIEAVETAAPRSIARVMRLGAHFCVALCGSAMAVWGGELVMRVWGHVIPSLGISRGLAYLSLPLAGALIVLFSLERAIADWRGISIDGEGTA